MSSTRDGDGRPLVAIILAAGIAVSGAILTAASAWAIIDRANNLSEGVVGLLSTAFGASIGAVSVYLGGARRDTGDDIAEPAQDPLALTDPITLRGSHERNA